MSATPAIDIHLVTEGTYPFHQGGVSVWCDQLVRGLPEKRFGVSAIAASGRERTVWPTPDNVAVVRPVALWGEARHGRRMAGRLARRVDEAHALLVDALLEEDSEAAHPRFTHALHDLHGLSLRGDVSARLRSEPAMRRLHAAWMSRPTDTRPSVGAAWSPTLADALSASDLLEHLLRPLWSRPPEAGLTHCVSNGLPGLVAMAAKWTHGTPFLLTEHGVYLRERYLAASQTAVDSLPVRSLLLRFYRLLTGASYAVADLVTPGSEYNLRWQLRCGADPMLVRPVHNGVDPAAFPQVCGEPDAPTLAWVGRVDPLKDVETLIRGFAGVHARMGEARLRMFGPTPPGNEPYRARCTALIAELGLEGAATFEGRVPSVTDAYRAGHVIVLSSASEGFPYTVIEAMASGRATVSTDVGGVREAVGDAGVVVPPRDPAAIAEACLAILRDDALRARLGAAARTRVLTQFTLQKFLDIYRDVYRGLDRPAATPAKPAVAHPFHAVAGAVETA